MAAEGDTMANRHDGFLLSVGVAALLLGTMLETASLQPAPFLAALAATRPSYHPGLLVAAFGLALSLWVRLGPGPARRQWPARIETTTMQPATRQGRSVDAAGFEAVAMALARVGAGPAQSAMLVVDIDGFRNLRRSYGQSLAEDVLCRFGDLLQNHMPAGVMVARIVADEFVVVLPSTGEIAAASFATYLQGQINGVIDTEAGPIDLGASIGIALSPSHGTTPDSLLRAARRAVAIAKRAGGRHWQLFEPSVCQAAEDITRIRAEIRAGLREGQFVPFYQPIVSLRSGEIIGMEVLARWHHPTRGLVLPDEFIPIMEAHDLCGALSQALLRQVTQDCRNWPHHWSFAFNASACQLPELIGFLPDSEPGCGDRLDPRRIELEVTETVLIEDMGLARRVVQAMHRAGAHVVLDDFGTGYANLLPLRELPFDRIKIDRFFVRDMLVSARTDACLRAMLSLARNLGATVVAEGVEEAATEARLRDMGCDFAQGYFYSPPVPAEGVARLGRPAQRLAVAA